MPEERRHGMEDVMYMLGEIRSDVKSIKEQTIKTNGRVNELETRMDENDKRHAEMDGQIKTWTTIAGLGASAFAFVIGLWR